MLSAGYKLIKFDALVFNSNPKWTKQTTISGNWPAMTFGETESIIYVMCYSSTTAYY